MDKSLNQNSFSLKKSHLIIGGIVLIAGGALLGWLFLPKQTNIANLTPVDVRVNSSDYKFINPLLFSRTSKDFYADEYRGLNNDLNKFITTSKSNGDATDVSIYYRDLNTSHWTGINETATYDPSSLLKVVSLMTYLKRSLSDPAILSKQLYYPGADQSGQYYKESNVLQPGDHSVLQLLKAMIIESDNTAKTVLTNNDPVGFDETYKVFRLPVPATSTAENDYMSARSYSVLFRSLYNSTYLPWDVSEQTLSLLSLTNFDKGIVDGLPQGTPVAHKFGEHSYLYTNGSVQYRELHDCGIVYYPDNPYLLCVMTRGNDFPALEKVISGISKIVYNYVKGN